MNLGALEAPLSMLVFKAFCRAVASRSKVHIKGRENIIGGPKIFACNHPTSFDFCYLYDITDGAAILMTRFVFELPVIGNLMNGCGFVRVDITGKHPSMNRAAYARALNELFKGRSILIAPTGEIEKGEGKKAKKGAARMARTTRYPIIPMGIRHEGDVRKFRLGKQPIRCLVKGETFLNIGKPYYVYSDDLEWHTDSLMSDIHVLAAQ